jgi:hypothetical protein
VLLTPQHHHIQSTNNYLNFDQLLAPIYWCYNVSTTNILAQLTWQHQYIGGTELAAPMGKQQRNTNFLRILRFHGFFKMLAAPIY